MPIFKGRIGARKKSISPKEHGIWDVAVSKLAEARSSIEAMENAVSRYCYTEAWGRFVDSLQEAWVSFDHEGKDSVPKYSAWIAPIYRQRKEDELLQYLYQARHQSQHGKVPLAWTGAHVKIAPNWSGHIARLDLFKDMSYRFDAQPQDGKSTPTLEYSPGDPLLPAIENRRYRQTFNPPKQHLKRALPSKDPVAAAKLALNYYEVLVQRAKNELLQEKT
ncbi:hypothetical protein [Wenzhouxiangella sp. EGI_FJ10409]|uniref:hypothetical protein n=1 Tax=Wenzhouxiangella sp. EGI_FJ10409 TaxID=3243767 RepID=UPI0035E39EEE